MQRKSEKCNKYHNNTQPKMQRLTIKIRNNEESIKKDGR